MSTAPAPNPDALQALLASLKASFSLGVNLPGEAALVAAFDFAKVSRTTMDPAIRSRLDAILCQQCEDAQYLWRHLLILIGVPLPPSKA